MINFSNIAQTDLHTHILPGMDDGAKTADISLLMLKKEQSDEIKNVVLSPHFYFFRESVDDFLKRRNESFLTLKKAINDKNCIVPKLWLAAEVYYSSSLVDFDLEQLCIENTDYMLLELPYEELAPSFLSSFQYFLYNINVKPVMVHIERFLKYNSLETIYKIMDMGVLCQINCGSLCEGLSSMITGKKRLMLELVKSGKVQLLGSDTHNMQSRPPTMAKARKAICSGISPEYYIRLMENSTKLLQNLPADSIM